MKNQIDIDQLKQRNPAKHYEIRENGTLRVATIDFDKTMTQQSAKDECDVNLIVQRHGAGIINYGPTAYAVPHINKKTGQYMDTTHAPTYLEALQTVVDAQTMFDALPAKLRKKFDNEPTQLLQFIDDPKNYDECVQLGIYNPKPKPQTPNEPNSQSQPQTSNELKPKP